MRKLNVLIWAIFFIFILINWVIKKMGYPVDSNTYLMVMVFVLFILYVIKKILLFRKIRDMQDPYERKYGNKDTAEKEEPVPTSPLEEKRKADKILSAKKGLFVIIAFIMMIGFRHGSSRLLNDMMLDGFDTTEDFFAEVDRKREFREAWD